MKYLINAILITIFALSITTSFASAQSNLCFENKGLKNINRISFTIEGTKITEGSYEIIGYDLSTSAESFEFTGTKIGNIMRIKFAGTVPYEHSPKSAPISWTLGKVVLSVPTYGKTIRPTAIPLIRLNLKNVVPVNRFECKQHINSNRIKGNTTENDKIFYSWYF